MSIHENADAAAAVRWWADQIDVDCADFQPPTLKRHRPKTVRYNTGADYHGCLVVRVLRGRELYWQIHGMVAATLRDLTLAARSVGVAWNDGGGSGGSDA